MYDIQNKIDYTSYHELKYLMENKYFEIKLYTQSNSNAVEKIYIYTIFYVFIYAFKFFLWIPPMANLMIKLPHMRKKSIIDLYCTFTIIQGTEISRFQI